MFLRRAGGAPRAGVACDRAGAAYGRAGVFFTGIRGGYIYLSRPKAAVFAGLNDRPTDEISFPPDSAVPIAAWFGKRGCLPPRIFPNFRRLASGAVGRGCGRGPLPGGVAPSGRGGHAAGRGVFHRNTGWVYIFVNGDVCAGMDIKTAARARGGAREGAFSGAFVSIWIGFSACGGAAGVLFSGRSF